MKKIANKVWLLIIVLLVCGCESMIEVRTVQWSGDAFSNRLNLPWWDPSQVPLAAYEMGLRSDGVMVWRTNRMVADEAEAMRLWREYEAEALRQHKLDRGEGWQELIDQENE